MNDNGEDVHNNDEQVVDDDDDDDDDVMMAQLRARMEAMVTEGSTATAAAADPLFAMEMMDQEEEDRQAMDALIAAEVAQAEAAAAASQAASSTPRAAADIDTTLLQDPDATRRRPWDDLVEAGSPAEHPPPFDRPHYSRGRRVTVVAYIPSLECHQELHNVLMRDFEREPKLNNCVGTTSTTTTTTTSGSSSSSLSSKLQLLAYYPIPHKRPIDTIMGHVEICAVLERDCDEDDTSRKSSDDEDDNEEEESDDEQEDEENAASGFGCFDATRRRRRRRHEQDDDDDDDVCFKLTNRFVAVKVNYWTRIVQMRDRHAEDPMKEIAAMQLVGDDLPGVMGCSEVLYVSGRDILDQAAKQQQQQHAQAGAAAVAKNKLFKRKYPPSDREQDNDTINVVMRYCQHGDLFDALQQPWRSSAGAGASSLSSVDHRPGFSEPQARFWFRQIMQGIRDLHDKGVCHRDLSPENVMIDDNGCLIIDLGMCLRVPYTTTTCTSGEPRTIVPLEPARSSSQDNQTQLQLQQQQSLLRKLLFMPQGACGKLPYMSPEIYRNRHAFDGAAVDVWCAGTILFCMLTGNRSYHRPHATDAQFYWMTHGLSQLLHDWNIELSPQGLHLLRNMLQVDPRLRLTIDEVLNHAWFQLPHEPINVQRIMS